MHLTTCGVGEYMHEWLTDSSELRGVACIIMSPFIEIRLGYRKGSFWNQSPISDESHGHFKCIYKECKLEAENLEAISFSMLIRNIALAHFGSISNVSGSISNIEV